MVKDWGPLGGDLVVCWAVEMEGDGKGDGLHLALPIHHSQPILVVFQMEESVFSHPNHCGRNSQAVGAGIEHPIPVLRSMETVCLRNEERSMMSRSKHPEWMW